MNFLHDIPKWVWIFAAVVGWGVVVLFGFISWVGSESGKHHDEIIKRETKRRGK